MRLQALCCLGMLALASTAHAQAAPSPERMAQGEAAISVRSDMQMAIRGSGGTPQAHLESLAVAVRERFRALKTCYRDRVHDEPSAEGAFRITLRVPTEGQTSLQMRAQPGSDAKLQDCVEGVLRDAPYTAVIRPAEAIVILQAENSRTAGQLRLEGAVRRNAGMDVAVDEEGRLYADWEGAEGQVRFKVRAAPGVEDPSAVRQLLNGLRSHYATFLDCRRRAGVRGMSPVGQLDFQLAPKPRGVRTEVLENTIESRRAEPCVRRALGRLVGREFDLPGPVWLSIHFFK